MKINITCNAGYPLTLDTISGMVSGIPDGTKYIQIGYLHLGSQSYSTEEIEEIKRVTIASFADKWHPWSQTPLVSSEYVKRPWRAGEKEEKINGILAAAISDDLMDMLSGAYGSEEQRAKDLADHQERDFVLERVEWVTQHLALGGSFQRFFPDPSWLARAEKLKGGTIYLA